MVDSEALGTGSLRAWYAHCFLWHTHLRKVLEELWQKSPHLLATYYAHRQLFRFGSTIHGISAAIRSFAFLNDYVDPEAVVRRAQALTSCDP